MTDVFTRAVAQLGRGQGATVRIDGQVQAVVGQTLEIAGLSPRVGTVLSIERSEQPAALAQVVGFRGEVSLAMPLTEAAGVTRGARVAASAELSRPPDPSACLGRVLDGAGRPLDGGPRPARSGAAVAARQFAPTMERARVETPLDVGIRAINALYTVGRGARMGVFAGSGVGKSTLLGQIARYSQAEVIVVGLVGERRREVREFVERELGDALGRSVVVVATSDEPAVLRRRAGELAADLAAAHAAEGRDVLLLMDSLTRFCAAQREIGLAAGEPPTTRGYPPSVWSVLPQLIERAGTTAGRGSVTGIYTVLVEGDDMEEPVADATRSLLDGHLVLSRAIAESGVFPPIDPVASLSRVMSDVVTAEHEALARAVRAAFARLADAEDLVRIGAYVAGSDPRLDAAMRMEPDLRSLMAQGRGERADWKESLCALRAAVEKEQA